MFIVPVDKFGVKFAYRVKFWDTGDGCMISGAFGVYPISFGSSSNLVVISFLFQLSSSFLILLKVVDMFAF